MSSLDLFGHSSGVDGADFDGLNSIPQEPNPVPSASDLSGECNDAASQAVRAAVREVASAQGGLECDEMRPLGISPKLASPDVTAVPYVDEDLYVTMNEPVNWRM